MGHFLENQNVLITGGSSGIGLAIARVMVEQGAAVRLAARSESLLTRAVRQIEGAHPKAQIEIATVDVSDPGQVERLFSDYQSASKPLHVLVNAAGVLAKGPFSEMTPSEIETLIRTNLLGTIHCCHRAVPLLRARGGGHILNLASLAGIRGRAGMAVYSASKFGVRGFSESLHREVRADGIKVSVLSPGYVNTPMVADVPIDPGDMIQPDDACRCALETLKLSSKTVASEIVISRLTAGD